MNETQRKKISELISNLNGIYEQIEIISNEEQEKYDNLPENLQESDTANAMQSAIDSLDSAKGYIDDAIANMEEIE